MILRADLPIKYYLGLHNADEVKDDSAVLFDILQYLIKVLQTKQKEINTDTLKFTSNSLKYIFGEKIKDETFKTELVKNIKRLIQSEHLSIDGDTIKITQKGFNKFY